MKLEVRNYDLDTSEPTVLLHEDDCRILCVGEGDRVRITGTGDAVAIASVSDTLVTAVGLGVVDRWMPSVSASDRAIVAVSPDHTNVFWDYSDQPFNLFGFVCLKNCLAFGVASVPGVYWVFPVVNNMINWLDEHWHKLLNIGTVVLFVVYMTIQVMFVSGNPPSEVFNLPRPYFDIGGVCEEGGPCPPPREKLSH